MTGCEEIGIKEEDLTNSCNHILFTDTNTCYDIMAVKKITDMLTGIEELELTLIDGTTKTRLMQDYILYKNGECDYCGNYESKNYHLSEENKSKLFELKIYDLRKEETVEEEYYKIYNEYIDYKVYETGKDLELHSLNILTCNDSTAYWLTGNYYICNFITIKQNKKEFIVQYQPTIIDNIDEEEKILYVTFKEIKEDRFLKKDFRYTTKYLELEENNKKEIE